MKQQNARVMKTTKIILSIALVALTSNIFGRIVEPEAGNDCCPTDLVIEQEMDLEKWMVAPFEASLETDLALENWMVAPFEASVEEELTMENWMAVPFEISDQQLYLDCWTAASRI